MKRNRPQNSVAKKRKRKRDEEEEEEEEGVEGEDIIRSEIVIYSPTVCEKVWVPQSLFRAGFGL